ncbi:hypothetical protein AYI68_g127 [Smittium mucronatum]|uniref:Uncharacterized protein n=1 Tax=Smittium mucronatum TaxID=133383 RepID=A0A1R0H930_9FUNG|nr:hypothetical protein AYI68_g127 [Smittium mucronatum]
MLLLVVIIGENLTGGLRKELNETPSKKYIRSSIAGSPAKLTDGSKSSPRSGTSVETDTEASLSLSLSSVSFRQDSTSGENP